MRVRVVAGIVFFACWGFQVLGAQSESLVITPEHRVWVTNRAALNATQMGVWVAARDLHIGDRFLLADGSEAVLTTTESAHGKVDSHGIHPNFQPSTLNLQPLTTYNLEVADMHTYFVGVLGVWVHNRYEMDVDNGLRRIIDNLEREGFIQLGGSVPGGWLRFQYRRHTSRFGEILEVPSFGAFVQIEKFEERVTMLKRLSEKIRDITEGDADFVLISEGSSAPKGRVSALPSRLRTKLFKMFEDGSYSKRRFKKDTRYLSAFEKNIARKFYLKKWSRRNLPRRIWPESSVEFINQTLDKVADGFKDTGFRF